MPLTLTDYRVGKATRRGVPIKQRVYPVVTAVSGAEVERCVGIRRGPRLTEWLRNERTSGRLICTTDGRMQSLIVYPDGRRERMYVWEGDQVPRARGRVSR